MSLPGMTMPGNFTARLDRVEAEFALRRLAHDYCVGADHRDRVRWEAIWATDAAWEIGPDRIFVGFDAICAAVEQQWRTFPIMPPPTTQWTSTVTARRGDPMSWSWPSFPTADGVLEEAPTKTNTAARKGYGASHGAG